MANPLVVMCSSAQDAGCAFAATPMMSVTMSTVVISGHARGAGYRERRDEVRPKVAAFLAVISLARLPLHSVP
jgi:hypothetical protein